MWPSEKISYYVSRFKHIIHLISILKMAVSYLNISRFNTFTN